MIFLIKGVLILVKSGRLVFDIKRGTPKVKSEMQKFKAREKIKKSRSKKLDENKKCGRDLENHPYTQKVPQK